MFFSSELILIVYFSEDFVPIHVRLCEGKILEPSEGKQIDWITDQDSFQTLLMKKSLEKNAIYLLIIKSFF